MLSTVRPLRKSDSESLHDQLTQQLAERIRGMAPGEQVPTELELMQTYDVSRTTVRRAVQSLVDDGLLARRQGRGTFILRPRTLHTIDRMTPFFDTVRRANPNLKPQIANFGWFSGLDVPAALGGPQTDALMYTRTYRDDEDECHAVLACAIAADCARDVEQSELEQSGLLAVLAGHGVVIGSAEMSVTSQRAGAVGEQLGLGPKDPILVLTRLSRTALGEPVEFTSHYLRSDRYTMRMSVHVEADAEPHPPQLTFVD